MKRVLVFVLSFLIMLIIGIGQVEASSLTPDQEKAIKSIIGADSMVNATRSIFLKDQEYDFTNDTIIKIDTVIPLIYDSITSYSIVIANYFRLGMVAGGDRWITMIFKDFDKPLFILYNDAYNIKLFNDIIPGKTLIYYTTFYAHGFSEWHKYLAEFGKKAKEAPIAVVGFFSYDLTVEDSIVFEDLDDDKIKEILVKVHSWGYRAFNEESPKVDETKFSVYKYVEKENKFIDSSNNAELLEKSMTFWNKK
jgi:hypothetical protein